MQNKIKICRIVLLCLFTLLIGCSKDDYQIDQKHIEPNSKVSFEQFKNETGLKDFKTSIQVQVQKNGALNRNADGSYELSDFNIDTDVIKRMELKQDVTYTFQVQPKGEAAEKIYNLVMYYREGKWETAIVELQPTKKVLDGLKLGQKDIFEGGMGIIYDSGSLNRSVECITLSAITSTHCPRTGVCDPTCDGCSYCVRVVTGSFCFGTSGSTLGQVYESMQDVPNPHIGGGGSDWGTPTSNDPPTTDPTLVTPPKKPIIIDPVITVDNEALLNANFMNGLSTDQQNWLNAHLDIKTPVLEYLRVNLHTSEGETFAKEMIDYARLNNNSPEAIQEIKDILDIMDDGMVNGEYVLVAPNSPINNMSDYLSCFNTSQGAIITIYANQPVAGFHDIISYAKRVGHAFISIRQGTKVKTLGFYPISSVGSIVPNPFTLQANDFLSTPGIFGNDQGHPYDVSLSLPLTPTGLANVINSIVTVANSNPQYNIGSMNCTDLAISIFNSEAIMNIPNCEAPSPWSGQTPGTLGEVIRDLSIPVGTGGIKNTNGGNAPNNNSN